VTPGIISTSESEVGLLVVKPLVNGIDGDLPSEEPELELGGGLLAGTSPKLRLFLVSGPLVFCQSSDAFMLARVSSAVYNLRAIAANDLKMVSVCQSVGPLYWGNGAGDGPSS
jgi:hypothetical protein